MVPCAASASDARGPSPDSLSLDDLQVAGVAQSKAAINAHNSFEAAKLSSASGGGRGGLASDRRAEATEVHTRNSQATHRLGGTRDGADALVYRLVGW